ncbi:MAG: cysteine synthase family protein [Elusimicrobia bacterium]|nr:cysteine synthase family protein [Elusimicrobiota bacterium]
MHEKVFNAVGSTPLVRIHFDSPAAIYAKLEYMNPGGSLKDRTALYMIEQAEKSGRLKKGYTIIDASSGNQGIAIAMVGAAKGYKVVITTTEKCSEEKLKTLKAFGAQVVVCPYVDRMDDPNSYHSVAVRMNRENPKSFMPNQYMNVENAEAHYHTSGPEIWKQTKGKITHFFAAAGTCGTVSGVGKYLKEKDKNIKVIAFDAKNSYYSTKGNPKHYKIEGMGIDFDTPVLYKEYIDEIIPVSDEDAFGAIKPIASKYGILGGLSSGAVAYGVSQYAPKMLEGSLGVMIFGDSGRAYLSKLNF